MKYDDLQTTQFLHTRGRATRLIFRSFFGMMPFRIVLSEFAMFHRFKPQLLIPRLRGKIRRWMIFRSENSAQRRPSVPPCPAGMVLVAPALRISATMYAFPRFLKATQLFCSGNPRDPIDSPPISGGCRHVQIIWSTSSRRVWRVYLGMFLWETDQCHLF